MDRVDYKTLKQWFFEDAFQWCQEKFEKGKINKWSINESEWGGHYILLRILLIRQ